MYNTYESKRDCSADTLESSVTLKDVRMENVPAQAVRVFSVSQKATNQLDMISPSSDWSTFILMMTLHQYKHLTSNDFLQPRCSAAYETKGKTRN